MVVSRIFNSTPSIGQKKNRTQTSTVQSQLWHDQSPANPVGWSNIRHRLDMATRWTIPNTQIVSETCSVGL